MYGDILKISGIHVEKPKNKDDPGKSFFHYQIEIILNLFLMTSKRMLQKREQIRKRIICSAEQQKMKCWKLLFRVSIEIGSVLMLMMSNRSRKKSRKNVKRDMLAIESR